MIVALFIGVIHFSYAAVKYLDNIVVATAGCGKVWAEFQSNQLEYLCA